MKKGLIILFFSLLLVGSVSAVNQCLLQENADLTCLQLVNNFGYNIWPNLGNKFKFQALDNNGNTQNIDGNFNVEKKLNSDLKNVTKFCENYNVFFYYGEACGEPHKSISATDDINMPYDALLKGESPTCVIVKSL